MSVAFLADRFGWTVGRRNVIVEGTSDVQFLTLARNLWLKANHEDLFDRDFAILPSGEGDEGGVRGVNEKLTVAQTFARSDLTPHGNIKYRFIGLFDNDEAGRRAANYALKIDNRRRRYRDIVVLRHRMPRARGAQPNVIELRERELNQACHGLDCEIEDLLSADLMTAFLSDEPDALCDSEEKGGYKHYKLTYDGKVKLRSFVNDYANLKDLDRLIELLIRLRDYLDIR